MSDEAQFLYLTTIGRKSGMPRQIEIWYAAYDGAYYLCSEARDQTQWAKNIMADPRVLIQIGSTNAEPIEGVARLIDADAEPELAAAVAALFDAKYGWSDGMFVELRARD